MKGKKLTALLLAAALVLLGGALWAVLTLTAPPEEEGKKTYRLIERDEEELERAVVTNGYGSYTVYRAGGDYTWQVEGNEWLPQQKSRYYDFARSCTSLTASYRLETDEYEKYGFDRPSATVEITFADGEGLTLTLGDRVRDESYRYYMLSGDDGVYAGNTSQFSYFLGESIMLVDTLLAPHVEGKYTNDAGDRADAVSVERDGVVYRFEVSPETVTDGYGNSYIHRQTSPAGGWSDLVPPEVFGEYFGRIMEFGAYKAVALADSDAALAGYGFDDPDLTLTVEYGGESAVVDLVPDDVSGDYFAHKRGTDVVWLVVSRLVNWAEIDGTTLITRYFAAPALEETTRLSVEVYGKELVADIAPDGSSSAAGVPLDGDVWDSFYRLACSAVSDTPCDAGAADGEEVAALIFEGSYGTRTLSLRRVSSRLLAVWVDGAFTGYSVRETFCERLDAGVDALLAGESVSTVW